MNPVVIHETILGEQQKSSVLFSQVITKMAANMLKYKWILKLKIKEFKFKPRIVLAVALNIIVPYFLSNYMYTLLMLIPH